MIEAYDKESPNGKIEVFKCDMKICLGLVSQVGCGETICERGLRRVKVMAAP
jgi:hypothetical protein